MKTLEVKMYSEKTKQYTDKGFIKVYKSVTIYGVEMLATKAPGDWGYRMTDPVSGACAGRQFDLLRDCVNWMLSIEPNNLITYDNFIKTVNYTRSIASNI